MIIDVYDLMLASEEELKKEYKELHKQLTEDNSAVKNRSDLVLNDAMQFIKTLLKDLHGVPAGELVKLDNPS